MEAGKTYNDYGILSYIVPKEGACLHTKKQEIWDNAHETHESL